MPTPRKAPSKAQLEDYLARGLKQREMADAYFDETGIKVTRSTIAAAMGRHGLSAIGQPRHEALLPWILRPEHRFGRDARYLRMESRRREGQDLSSKDLRRLNAWMAELIDRNAVIYYDPDSRGGWWWIERTPADQDLIRDPEALIPWAVKVEHRDSPDYALLDLEVRRRRGEVLTEGERNTLAQGLAELDESGQVVAYSRSTGFERVAADAHDTDYVRHRSLRLPTPDTTSPGWPLGDSYCPSCGSRQEPDPSGACPRCSGPLTRILGTA